MKKTTLNLKPIAYSIYTQLDWEILRQDIRDEYGNKSLLTTYNDKRLYGRRIKFSTHPNVNRDEIIGFIKGRGYRAERHPQGYVLIHLGSPDPNS